jgi:hypothetical protein
MGDPRRMPATRVELFHHIPPLDIKRKTTQVKRENVLGSQPSSSLEEILWQMDRVNENETRTASVKGRKSEDVHV